MLIRLHEKSDGMQQRDDDKGLRLVFVMSLLLPHGTFHSSNRISSCDTFCSFRCCGLVGDRILLFWILLFEPKGF